MLCITNIEGGKIYSEKTIVNAGTEADYVC